MNLKCECCGAVLAVRRVKNTAEGTVVSLYCPNRACEKGNGGQIVKELTLCKNTEGKN